MPWPYNGKMGKQGLGIQSRLQLMQRGNFQTGSRMTNFTHPVTSQVPVELLQQQVSIGSNKTLPETLCIILAHSGKINSNCNRAKKAQAHTQRKGEPTAPKKTSKPSQNAYSLPKQSREETVSLSLKWEQKRRAILTDNIMISTNGYELVMINFGLKAE